MLRFAQHDNWFFLSNLFGVGRERQAMDLATAIKCYLEITGGFDRPLHLSQLGLPKAETEKLISAWDEDYQISRYLLLSRERDADLAAFPADQRVFLINGFECTHLSFHGDIAKLI